jgi:hypothetical protein
MQRVLTAMVIGITALALASAAQASQCPKLIAQIHQGADNRLDASGYEARMKADEAEKLHKAGKHAESEKVAKEGLDKLK